jgi:predicted Zn-dependent protease
VLEGEELVRLYSGADLPAELTGPFEARVVEWIPRATLQSGAGFARLAAGHDEAQLAPLAPRARRARLQELAARDPEEARWPLLLAQLERAEGEARAAHEAAERALRLAPNAPGARSVRGWARVELSRHAEAVEDLAGCSAADPSYAGAELTALVRLEQWARAHALVAGLSEAQRSEPRLASLIRRVEQEAPAQTPPAETGAASPPPGKPPAVVAPTTVATPGPATPLAAQDETLLTRIQAEVGRAQSTEQVLAVYATAAELASRHPSNRRVQHTAAEIAYRASLFPDAVRHFRQGGDPGEDQPLLLFYMAVALWETGARAEAAEAMRRCDGKLRPTPFFESYRRRILGGSPTPG